jgi:anti-sigma B factor antagonist
MAPFPEPPSCRIDIRPVPDGTIVAVAGELDIATAPDLAAALREHLAAGPVTLDLAELSFMDSSGVRVLDAVVGEVQRERWSFRIRPELHDHVRQVLEMTGLYEGLPFAGDERSRP